MQKIKEVLRIGYETGTSVLLVGQSGVGKSDIVKQFCEELNEGKKKAGEQELEFVHLTLGQMSPGDVQGVGSVVEVEGQKFTRFCVGEIFNTGGKPAFLFLDEVNRAHPAVIQSIFELLLTGAITSSKFRLPEGSYICCAANPTDGNGNDYYLSSQLDDAFLGRVSVVGVEPNKESFLEYIENKYDESYSRQLDLLDRLVSGFELCSTPRIDNGDSIGGYRIKAQERKIDWAIKALSKFNDKVRNFGMAGSKDDAIFEAAFTTFLRGLVGQSYAMNLLSGVSGTFVTLERFFFGRLNDVISFNRNMISTDNLTRKRQVFAIVNSTVQMIKSNPEKITSNNALMGKFITWLFTHYIDTSVATIQGIIQDALMANAETMQVAQSFHKYVSLMGMQAEDRTLDAESANKLEEWKRISRKFATKYYFTSEELTKFTEKIAERELDEFLKAGEGADLSKEELELLNAVGGSKLMEAYTRVDKELKSEKGKKDKKEKKSNK